MFRIDKCDKCKKLKFSSEYHQCVFKDDNYYYIIIKGDVKERSEEYATENHDNMVDEMKSEDFEKIIDGWVEELNINVNSQAVKRYTPQVVYDKQEEYYSKNQNN